MGKTILCVDDEKPIREMVSLVLRQNKFQYLDASDAIQAQSVMNQQMPDLILLDWMMPGISGIEFVHLLRNEPNFAHIPIIMLTARTEEDNMIRGLNSGADDYLTKPFSAKELIARIYALLRRSTPENGVGSLERDGLKIDLDKHRVTVDGTNVNLGPTEFRLLRYFMENPERAYSRSQVLNAVWGMNIYVELRTVDVHIRRLRKALTPTGYAKFIQTVRGIGYRFSDKE
jgi:two-component system phosphate regulon response regulator PhoB